MHENKQASKLTKNNPLPKKNKQTNKQIKKKQKKKKTENVTVIIS